MTSRREKEVALSESPLTVGEAYAALSPQKLDIIRPGRTDRPEYYSSPRPSLDKPLIPKPEHVASWPALKDPLDSPFNEAFLSKESKQIESLSSLAVQAPRMTALKAIAMLGNHLPRQCGIATFTTDLSEAISAEFASLECAVLAMNDNGHRYSYSSRVQFEIEATDLAAYRRAADFLSISQVELVSVQHEYGIFGGQAGSHLLAILRDLRLPIVTTLHTILAEPDPSQRLVMDELTQLSDRLVVMSAHGAALLQEVHKVPDRKIDIIPHGIPGLPDSLPSKKQLGLEGKSVLLTFGLLSPVKGIEHVIDALPEVLEQYPDTIYIVLGVTHPHVKASDGEAYRLMLEDRARKLGVDSRVIFHNHFVSQDELTLYLAAADIYITPYLNPEQSTSGTLAYAVGTGKAVISTPYSYARELLSDDRGVLVPWPEDDPRAIERAVIGLLADDSRRAELHEQGSSLGRDMRWPEVARCYIKSFEQARAEHTTRLQTAFRAKTLAEQPIGLPTLDLRHLELMSDHTGIFQHAVFSVPRYDHGYCIDDNARALLLTSLIKDGSSDEMATVRVLAARYLAFVNHAFDPSRGRFKNFMSYSRRWIDEPGSEDCHGRTLWALGTVIGHAEDPGIHGLAHSLFHDALMAVLDFTSPRAWAYTLLGIHEYLRAFLGERKVQAVRERLAERLYDLHQRTSSPTWPWFEERLTYCNARLSQALLVAGYGMEHEGMKAAGLRSLEWLAEIQRPSAGGEYFAPIGSNGFYQKGGVQAVFDQQPVEACAMVSACLAAQRLTGDMCWASEAQRAFSWFLGQNLLQQPLYDATTGGCRDGLHQDRPNENQGAESTLSFLLALVEMRSSTPSTPATFNHLTGTMTPIQRETTS